MLHDFTYYNPTKIHFGKEAMSKLPTELNNYGKISFFFTERTQ